MRRIAKQDLVACKRLFFRWILDPHRVGTGSCPNSTESLRERLTGVSGRSSSP